MAPSRHRLFFAAVIVAMSFPAFDVHGQSQDPTALEMAQLPKFCWGQFRVPNVKGAEFGIQNCGPAMNHYCFGLMYLIRARAVVGKKGERLALLGHADADIRYTENAMKDYPKCEIRDHVLKSRIEVNNLLHMYGGKPMPPAK